MAKFSKIRKQIEAIDEINMTPVMSLFVTLIPILLLSAVFLKVNIINSPFPRFSGKPADLKKEEAFVLNLFISKKGFRIESTGNKHKKKKSFEIYMKGGEYQLKELHQKIVDVKRYFPKEYRLNLYPEPSIDYETIVNVMDATRRLNNDDPKIFIRNDDGQNVRQEYLFPDVVWMGVLSKG